MLDLITHFWALVPVTVAQSLILSFVVLAIMIPFRILGFPDLTSEGAYPLRWSGPGSPGCGRGS